MDNPDGNKQLFYSQQQDVDIGHGMLSSQAMPCHNMACLHLVHANEEPIAQNWSQAFTLNLPSSLKAMCFIHDMEQVGISNHGQDLCTM
jgi:hypothetical protein